jgi:hypothetical protein
MSTYNQGGKNSFIIFMLVIAALAVGACLIISSFLNNRRDNPTQEVLVFSTSPPSLVQPTALEIPTDQPISPQAFTTGTFWYPYRCTLDSPARCTFVQQNGITEYWAICQEPEKNRPTYYQANANSFDWYVLGTEGILYPEKEGSSLQSFRFLEEGQAK